MNAPKRPRRKDPERAGPVRNLSKLYSQSSVAGDTAETRASTRHTHPKPPPGDSRISDGVGLAYRVFERYIDAGRKSAEQFSKQASSTAPMNRPLQELVDRMLRSQAEMLPLWLDLFGSLARVDSSRMVYPANPDTQSASNGAVGSHNISIALASRQPVEISLDLHKGAERRALATPGLQALDRRKPALTDIRFDPENGRHGGKLTVKVPSSQPAGLYSGVVVDSKSGAMLGTLSIRVTNNHSAAGMRAK